MLYRLGFFAVLGSLIFGLEYVFDIPARWGVLVTQLPLGIPAGYETLVARLLVAIIGGAGLSFLLLPSGTSKR